MREPPFLFPPLQQMQPIKLAVSVQYGDTLYQVHVRNHRKYNRYDALHAIRCVTYT